MNAVRIECRRGRKDDGQRYDAAECHAGKRVHPDSRKLGACLFRRDTKRLGMMAMLLLHFLPGLPEKQIGADSRPENSDQRSCIGRSPLNFRH